ITLVVGSLTGCTLAPRYERPVAPISQTWPSGSAYATNELSGFITNAAAEIGWREFFQDARLQKLIDLALANNRDLRVAVLNVEQSRAVSDSALRLVADDFCLRERHTPA